MLNLSVYVSARFIAPWFEVVYAHSLPLWIAWLNLATY